jgi:hypothetical protein
MEDGPRRREADPSQSEADDRPAGTGGELRDLLSDDPDEGGCGAEREHAEQEAIGDGAGSGVAEVNSGCESGESLEDCEGDTEGIYDGVEGVGK